MLTGTPPGTAGTAYPSGWMTCKIFIKFLNHFIHHTKPSTANPLLLVLDNHECHIRVKAINLQRDVAVYCPLKAHYSKACTS
jgi:hypothetical protein